MQVAFVCELAVGLGFWRRDAVDALGPRTNHPDVSFSEVSLLVQVFAVSAYNGKGLDAVKTHLQEALPLGASPSTLTAGSNRFFWAWDLS